MTPEQQFKPIPAYEGDDMAGYLMEQGFKIPQQDHSKIKSITNVRSTAIIVTERSIWLAEPSRDIGFCIKLLAHLYW